MVQYLGVSTGGAQPGQNPPRSEDITVPPIPFAFGSTVLVAGAKVVALPQVTANSNIQVTSTVLGTVTAASAFLVTRTPGTGFTITASQATDTSTVSYLVIG